MEQKKTSKPIWLVMTGFSCNSNCIMCSTRPKAEFHPDRKTQEIIGDLTKGIKEGYSRVEFTGGEPTIRPDILHLIKLAKSLGYEEVGISTNARMLSYKDFCQNIVENGVNRVTFTLNAHNSKLGDAICRTTGAFDQTIKGVKNILEYQKVAVSANTVASKLNYKHFKKIGELIYDMGIKYWHILDLIPDGYAKKFYKILSVKPSNLSKSFNVFNELSKEFGSIVFFDFPLCLFSNQILENPKINFITAQERTEKIKQTGYKPKRFEKSADNLYEDIHKQRIKVCKNCKFNKSCGGVWKEALDLYGKEEIELLAKKHDCLNK